MTGQAVDLSTSSFLLFLLYGDLFIVSGVLHHLMKSSRNQFSYIEVTCIYGYSLFPLALTLLLCCVPYTTIKWISLFIGCYYPFALLYKEFWEDLLESTLNQGIFVAVGSIIISKGWVWLYLAGWFLI